MILRDVGNGWSWSRSWVIRNPSGYPSGYLIPSLSNISIKADPASPTSAALCFPSFEIHDLKVLMSTCTIKPSVNQILFDPHTYAETTPLLEYCAQHSIIIEAYTALGPLRSDPDGLIARVTSAIARRLDVQPEQVLMAWVKSKG